MVSINIYLFPMQTSAMKRESVDFTQTVSAFLVVDLRFAKQNETNGNGFVACEIPLKLIGSAAKIQINGALFAVVRPKLYSKYFPRINCLHKSC